MSPHTASRSTAARVPAGVVHGGRPVGGSATFLGVFPGEEVGIEH
jgi:hypothetical protein